MTVKCLVGYTIVPGLTPEEYDRWLWDIHVPDLMANPHLDRIVFNTVVRPVSQTSGGTGEVARQLPLYRVAEMHYADMDAYQAYLDWFAAHPLPVDRGPAGRSDFQFYVLCTVEEASREAYPRPSA